MSWNSIGPRLLKKCVCTKRREHLLHGWAQLVSILIIKGSGVQLLRRKCASNLGKGEGWADLPREAGVGWNSGDMAEGFSATERCYAKAKIPAFFPKSRVRSVHVCVSHGTPLGLMIFMCVYMHMFGCLKCQWAYRLCFTELGWLLEHNWGSLCVKEVKTHTETCTKAQTQIRMFAWTQDFNNQTVCKSASSCPCEETHNSHTSDRGHTPDATDSYHLRMTVWCISLYTSWHLNSCYLI